MVSIKASKVLQNTDKRAEGRNVTLAQLKALLY